MKIRLIVSLIALTVCSVTGARAATLPGSIGDDFLGVASPDRWSVGVNVEGIQRMISLDHGPDVELDVFSGSVFIGYDAKPWLTIFGTFGQSEDNSDYGGNTGSERKFKWSAGANANLLKWHLRQPRVMTGDRITIRAFAEFASYETGGNAGADWTDIFIALPIAYDRIERNARIVEDSELFRLSIYAGPALSLVNGDVSISGGRVDFEEVESLGLVAGLDIYFTRSISLGGQAQLFDLTGDDVSARASLRYHF